MYEYQHHNTNEKATRTTVRRKCAAKIGNKNQFIYQHHNTMIAPLNTSINQFISEAEVEKRKIIPQE